MSVEVVSIVSSGVVARGSVAMTVGFGTYNARKQRAHEKTLADKAAESEHRLSYESRAWDRKVEAHLDVIKSLSRLDRIMTRVDTPGVAIEHLVTSTLMELNDAQPVIIAYGSEQCRDDLARDSLADLEKAMAPAMRRRRALIGPSGSMPWKTSPRARVSTGTRSWTRCMLGSTR